MAAAAWDALAKAANLAQVSAMLVAVFTSLRRVQQSNMRECARLERCTCRLHALLQWPATGCGGIGMLLCSEVGYPVVKAAGDAAELVESYKKTTLWRRIWSGGRMATRLRDMQDVVDSYCGLLLFVNAHLLLQQQATHHPSSPDTRTTTYARFILRRVTHHQVQVAPRLPAKLKYAWKLIDHTVKIHYVLDHGPAAPVLPSTT